MEISSGNGGWHELRDVGLPGRTYVRAVMVDGRPRITEMYVDGDGEPIQAGALRAAPFGAMEGLVAELVADLGPVATTAGHVAGPDLSRLAAYYATTWGAAMYAGSKCDSCSAPLRGTSGKALTEWPVLAWLAQYGEVPQAPRPARRDDDEDLPEVVLAAPQSGLTDEFLADVARAYRAAVRLRKPPATTLAALAGVERRTVESWIYKARKRGIMPPAAKRGRII